MRLCIPPRFGGRCATKIDLVGFFIADGYYQRLERIVVDAGNPIYDCREECNAIIETGTNTLIAGCHKSTIPASVQRIGYRPLVDCEGLREVTIPDKVTYICRGAFSYCSRLKKVYAYPTVPPEIEQDVFDDIADGAVLYVPKGSIEAYEASDWKQYFAAIRAIRK